MPGRGVYRVGLQFNPRPYSIPFKQFHLPHHPRQNSNNNHRQSIPNLPFLPLQTKKNHPEFRVTALPAGGGEGCGERFEAHDRTRSLIFPVNPMDLFAGWFYPGGNGVVFNELLTFLFVQININIQYKLGKGEDWLTDCERVLEFFARLVCYSSDAMTLTTDIQSPLAPSLAFPTFYFLAPQSLPNSSAFYGELGIPELFNPEFPLMIR